MKPLEQAFRLDVPSSPENLSMIRDFVSRIGAQAGLAETEVNNLELAVDEACANVIEHAYGDQRSGEIVVRALFDEDAVRITIVDTGRGFDPKGVTEADLGKLVHQRKTGGLGLRIIKSLMDEVRYEVEPGTKNELQMVKRIKRS